MTDRDALIKELQHMVDTGEWGAGTMRKAIQALSAPGDAEPVGWVIPVPAENFPPMFSKFDPCRADAFPVYRRPVAPVVTAEDAADRMARLRHQMPLKNLSDIIQNSYLELARAALNVSQPGVK